LWDQRLWHRGSTRKLPGDRIVTIFGFWGVNVNGKQIQRRLAQQGAYQDAQTDEHRVVFGGMFKD